MKNGHFILYGLISIFLLIFIKKDYLLLLDMIFSFNINITSSFYGLNTIEAILPLFLFIKLINSVIPAVVIQKIILFSIFFLSGISMHNLINTKRRLPRYFAGLFYMINPFVYVRFMAGHWLFLLGYAILPFTIKSIMDFLEKQDKKQIIKTCLMITLTAIFSTHMLFLVLFLFLIFFIFKFKKQLIKPALFLALVFLVLNFYWLIPVLTAESTNIGQISEIDLQIFATRGGIINVLTNSAMLYGFWREEAYILPNKIIPIFFYFSLFIIILYLTIHGYLNLENKYKKAILVTAILSLFLAVGISHPWFSDSFLFLFKNLFFMRGFREPQKFLALVAFAYAYFSAYGIDALLENPRRYVKGLLILLLILPILYTPTMFNSFWGQLGPTDYPKDWYEINEHLNQDKQEFSVLFLPWHGYMNFKFVQNQEKRIANPAKSFFNKPVIQADNIETGPLYSHTTNTVSLYIEEVLKNKIDTAERLRLIDVKYIILAKEVNYKDYEYLLNQSNLKLVKESENLYLIENNLQVNKFYQSDDLKELEPWGYEKKSTIRYNIEKPTKKYVIFTEAYNSGWELGDEKPLEGTVNVYEYNGENVLKYKRFNTYLVSYIISGVFFLGLLYLWWKRR